MYAEHNAAVTRLVREQQEMANTLVAEGERPRRERTTRRTPAIGLYKAQLGIRRTSG